MNSKREYLAKRIGHVASRLIQRTERATLRGHTSKGLYIQTESRWILFLSFGRAVGPLSITMERDVMGLEDVQPGATVEIKEGCLVFPAEGVVINARAAGVWNAPVAPDNMTSRESQLQRLDSLARRAVEAKRGLGLSVLLPCLLWPQAVVHSDISPVDTAILEWVSTVRNGLVSGRVSQVLQGAQYLLGRGRGLTPSGDDFFLGIMLATSRWERDLMTTAKIERLRRDLVSLSYKKTTGLSGNLIECAARGEADERLLAIVDSIFCGVPSVESGARPMLTWGSSSGVDTMVGMAVVLLAAVERV